MALGCLFLGLMMSVWIVGIINAINQHLLWLFIPNFLLGLSTIFMNMMTTKGFTNGRALYRSSLMLTGATWKSCGQGCHSSVETS